ncbi:MAG: methyltransferase [Acidobacteria bacterium]|nr:methyltransferase [Acidobacteriota bacterium]
MIDVLRREVAARRLGDDVQITVCGSLGLCERGPNVVVYPEGIWYSGVRPEDVAEIVESHFQKGQVVERLVNRDGGALYSEICANRDQYLAGLKARDAAGVMPEDLALTIRGFQDSRVILTAVELDIFTAVAQGSDAARVAARIGTDPRATGMLLNALVALGLLSKRDSVFYNSPAAARFFVEGSPDDSRAATMHTVHLWSTWSTLTECVRKGTAVARRDDRGGNWTQAFIAAMDRNAAGRAPLVARTVGAEGVRRMLDVGGGSGAYSIAFAKANDKLQADILDVPEVVPIQESRVRKAGLSGRIHPRAGDLKTDKLGEDYDLVFVSAICHMLGPEENQDLVKRCRAALAPGGRLVIQDFILEADKTAPKSAALFSLNMLVGTQHGASYSEDEYTAWMRDAGFTEVRRVRLPGPTGLMIGTRA